MSWREHKKNIDGIRKVKWDELWHIFYFTDKAQTKMTYDRVNKSTAMRVLKMIERNRKNGKG